MSDRVTAEEVLAWWRAGCPNRNEHGDQLEIATGPADPVIDRALRVLVEIEKVGADDLRDACDLLEQGCGNCGVPFGEDEAIRLLVLTRTLATIASDEKEEWT